MNECLYCAPDVVVEDGCVAAGGGERGLVPGECRDARRVAPQLAHLLHAVRVPDLHLQTRRAQQKLNKGLC